MTLFLALSSLAPVCPKLASLVLPLAQATDDTLTEQPQQMSPVAAVILGVFVLLVLVVALASMWKIFTKAGQPGWASIIPIYNFYVMCKMAGKPGWWCVLMFIPFVNFIILILVFVALAQSFGKGAGFGIGLALLGIVFLPILAFGDARYLGSATPPPLV